MKASFFETARYVPPRELVSEWPVPGEAYDRDAGSEAYTRMEDRLRCVEEMGFDWVSFSEHHYSPRIMTPNPILSATYIAARLSKIGIAVLGPIVPQLNPVRIAEELAMLDIFTGGRLRVGLLRGTTNELLTYDLAPGEARERTTEGMELILKSWTEPQPFGWQGRYFQFRNVSIWPRPLQKPYPPTYALGTSRESCQFAARHHLGLGASFAPYDLVCKATAYYREQCAAEGWEPDPEQIVYRANICIAASDEGARAALLERGSAGMFPIRAAVNRTLVQLDQRNVAGIPRVVSTGSAEPEDATAVVGTTNRQPTQFIGSPETIVEQVKRARDEVGCGVIDFSFQNAAAGNPELLMQSLELFGDKVLPRIGGV
jgi:alkanesulfonate monooxygenase SsuD/methylene tetrahydromethanopterin reductase-like flavin-dependent oxidoreductase (luciferase family)